VGSLSAKKVGEKATPKTVLYNDIQTHARGGAEKKARGG
jgi:hypothetical protein